ncbi:MAG: tctC6 [Deltaproteobacteria bacterium]|nr:tctC6 [Deltaproteobacteria bacterium]
MNSLDFGRCAAVAAGVGLATALLMVPCAAAQSDWKPERAVEIVSATSGSAAERAGRLAMMLMQEKNLVPTPVAMVVKIGAGGSLAHNFLATKAGNAHYLLLSTMSLTTNTLTGLGALGYRDFTPIAMLFDEYLAVFVRADSPIKDGRDLLERLKKDPASLSNGISSALGSATHLGPMLAFKTAGVDVRKMRTVVFNSASNSVIAVLGGHVDFASASLSSTAAQVDAGGVRLLGLTAPQRIAGKYAQVPTWKEQGADAWLSSYRGIIAPKAITEAQIAYWEDVFTVIDADPRWLEYAETYMVNRQFRKSRDTRKYLDDLEAKIKPLLADLGMLK